MSPIERPRWPRRAAGFTLIEMLLASALLLIAAVTAAGFMNQGVKIFLRLADSGREEAAAVCLEKMTRDLRSAVDYSLIPFVQGEQEIAFASLRDLSARPADPDPSPFEVSYRLDAETSRIVRSAVYGQTFERAEAVRTEIVLNGVRSLSFEYEGEPDEIPAKITVRIEYGGLLGSRSAARDIVLPAAPLRSDRR